MTGQPTDSRSSPDGPELDLYAVGVWKLKHWIVGFAAAVGLLVFLGSLLVQPRYAAVATLVVIPPDASPRRSATLSAMIDNHEVAGQVVAELGLTAPPHSLDASRFLRDAVRVSAVPQSELLTVTVTLVDPDAAAGAANLAAELGARRSSEVAEAVTTATMEEFERELAHTRERLQEAGTALVEFQRQARIELQRSEAEAFVELAGSAEGVSVDIATERARQQQLTESLSDRERILSLRRSIIDEPAMVEGARPPGSPIPLDLELASEIVDPVHVSLEADLLSTGSRLAGLESRRDALGEGRNGDYVSALDQLYADEQQLSRLQLEYEVAQAAYQALERQGVQARADATLQKATLRLVDSAVPPSYAISPRPVFNGALAGVLGLVLAAAVALVRVHIHTATGSS